LKSFTSPAKCVVKALASKPVILAMPDFPASKAAQDASTVLPTGLTQPKPVTTTRLRDIKRMLRNIFQKMVIDGLRMTIYNDKMDKRTANDGVCASLSIKLKRIKLRFMIYAFGFAIA
jgi:hypothetical protein